MRIFAITKTAMIKKLFPFKYLIVFGYYIINAYICTNINNESSFTYWLALHTYLRYPNFGEFTRVLKKK